MQVEQLLSTRNGVLVKGPLLLKPRVFGDDRGFFFESWNQRAFVAALVEGGWSEADAKRVEFRQDNHSRSSRGVLRGLHYQLMPEPQGKLVRCTVGAIFDVAVDLRRSSDTFGHWVAAELTAENHQQLWVPVGFGHGFLTLSDQAEVLYKASGFWNRDCERSLRWDAPQLAIDWPLESAGVKQPLLAEKDAAAPTLSTAESMGALF
jgi:dTDP-4-dehydrorhamnose 3,5-epimerase